MYEIKAKTTVRFLTVYLVAFFVYGPSLVSLSNPERDGWVESHLVPTVVSRVLNVGGNANSDWSNSVQYGLSYANANNDTSNSNANIGSRLYFVRHYFAVTSTLPNGRTSESTTTSPVAMIANDWRKNKGGLRSMRSRLSNCYGQICSLSVLEAGAENACKPREDRKEVRDFRQARDSIIRQIQYELSRHLYVPGKYKLYYKWERGKMRLIADLPLYHRIVHCAIAIVIEERLNRTLIYQTHASRVGHGTHTLMADLRRHLYNDQRLCYGLSMDIDQCYASIPPEGVKRMLREYIKDKELLWLLDIIIDSYNETGRPGIALGGRLSPLFANLYLSSLDHYLKEKLHVHVMGRYLDNYYILGYSKPWLHQIHKEVVAYLGELGLKLNDNVIIQPIDSTHGMDVVGWVIYSDHVLIRKKTKERMRKAFRAIQYKLDHCQEINSNDKGVIGSYTGSLKWFDSYNLC